MYYADKACTIPYSYEHARIKEGLPGLNANGHKSTNPYYDPEWDIQDALEVYMDISKKGYRLPTVEEWQLAAKGGQDYTYAGSNEIDEVAWYDGNSNFKPHPVAQKKANGYGLYDMSGNVWEWCWYSRYGLFSCGGSWDYDDSFCEVSSRSGADHQGGDIGFRIVRSVK